MCSVVAHRLCLTLEQTPIEEKTKEVPPHFTTLLKRMKLPGGTWSIADALHPAGAPCGP